MDKFCNLFAKLISGNGLFKGVYTNVNADFLPKFLLLLNKLLYHRVLANNDNAKPGSP